LERRYEFPDYPRLRDFLDRAAELSEREGLYPGLGLAVQSEHLQALAVPAWVAA
jgi:hypothetical protein